MRVKESMTPPNPFKKVELFDVDKMSINSFVKSEENIKYYEFHMILCDKKVKSLKDQSLSSRSILENKLNNTLIIIRDITKIIHETQKLSDDMYQEAI